MKRNSLVVFGLVSIITLLMASCSNMFGPAAGQKSSGVASISLRVPLIAPWIQSALSGKAIKGKALSSSRAIGVIGKVTYVIKSGGTAVTGGSGTFTPSPSGFDTTATGQAYTHNLATSVTLNPGPYTIDVQVFNNAADSIASVKADAWPFTITPASAPITLGVTCVPNSPDFATLGSAYGVAAVAIPGLTTAFNTTATTVIFGSEKWYQFIAGNTSASYTKVTIDATGGGAVPAFAVYDASGNFLTTGEATVAGGQAVATFLSSNSTVYNLGIIDVSGSTTAATARAMTAKLEAYTPPPGPSGLTLWRTTDRSVDFYWTQISGATAYKVYKGISTNDTNPTYFTTVAGEEATISGFTPGQTYYLYMKGVVNGGDTVLSTCLSGVTLATSSLAVPVLSNPALTDITESDVTLTWTDSTSGAAPYAVFMDGQYMGEVSGITSGIVKNGFGSSGSFSLPASLKGNTVYKFYIVALDSGVDCSVPSNEITVTTNAIGISSGTAAYTSFLNGIIDVASGTLTTAGTVSTYNFGSGSVIWVFTLGSGTNSTGTITFKDYTDTQHLYTLNGSVTQASVSGVSTYSGTLTLTGYSSSTDGPVSSMVLNTSTSASSVTSGDVKFNGATVNPASWLW